MTTQEVMRRFDVAHATAAHWAKKNGVARQIIGGIAAFDWTEADCERFAARRGTGWQKGKPRKKGGIDEPNAANSEPNSSGA